MKNPIDPPAEVRPAEDLHALAKRINAAHEAGEGAARQGLEHFRAAGEALLKAKAQCAHGKWLAWLEKNIRCGRTQAWRYMALAKCSVTEHLDEQWRIISGNAPDDDDPPNQPAPTPARLWDEPQHPSTPAPQSSAPRDTPPQREQRPPDAPPPPAAKKKTWLTVAEWQGMSAAQRKRALAESESDSGFNRQENASIEWSLWSWNPVSGCMHDCPYCYARDIAERFYPQKFEPSLYPGRLQAPRRMRFPADEIARLSASDSKDDRAKATGLGNVFTCSMADLFGRWVPAEWIELVLKEVRAAPQWNFLFLTKFPIRLAEFEFPDNAWVGTTVDCQIRVANAERAFRKVKAKVKWLSCEPMIEPLHFTSLEMFDWVVIGGASVSSITPEWHPPREWSEDLRKKAMEAGCGVYEKTNLLQRYRDYPGSVQEQPKKAPRALVYLPVVE